MLTAEQRAIYETAARLYCQRIGENPEARVPMPHPNLNMPEPIPGRMWWLAAEKIHDMSMLLTAMKDAAVAKQDLTKVNGANDEKNT